MATITLNRPEKRNAISFELIDDLLRALEQVDKSEAIVLILTGAGKAFCSGMDLENLKSLLGRSTEQNLQDSQTMVQVVPRALRVSEGDYRRREWPGHRRRNGVGVLMRFHAGGSGREVWLYGSAHRVCSCNCFDISIAAGGRKAGSRSAADGKNFQRGGSGSAWD